MSAASTPCPKCPWPCAIPYCTPRRLTICLISKLSFQGQVWQKGIWQRLSASKGRQPSLTSIQLGTRPGERAVQLTESPPLNEMEWGQRRVNLLPLEAGPCDEGEENNLYKEQRRQSAILEKKWLCRARRMICPRFSPWGHFLDLRLYLTLKLQSQGGEGGIVTFRAGILELWFSLRWASLRSRGWNQSHRSAATEAYP